MIGDSITSSITSGVPDWPTNTATVGGGVEYTLVLNNVTITADIGADTITVTYENTSQSPNVTIGPSDFLFSDLDWPVSPGDIDDVIQLASNFPGAIGTLFTSDSVTLKVGLTNTNPGDLFSATFQLQQVPEPSVALLLGTGLMLLGWRRRPAR